MSETDAPDVGLTEQEVDVAFWRDKEAGNCKSDRGGYYADGWRDGYRIGVAAERERANTEALRNALSAITTHNGKPVSPENLRWAATHEALCRSYIFDVLIGLAAALDTPREDQP